MQLTIVFVVGALASWTPIETNIAFMQASSAVQLWRQAGVGVTVKSMTLGASWDSITMGEANAAINAMPRSGKTLYLVLRPVNWTHGGFAKTGQYGVIGWREGMDDREMQRAMAHELGHVFGATERELSATIADNDIMTKNLYWRVSKKTIEAINDYDRSH